MSAGDKGDQDTDQHEVLTTEKVRLARVLIDRFGFALAIIALAVPIKASESILTRLAGEETILTVDVSFALGVTFVTSVAGGLKIWQQRAELRRLRERQERLEKQVKQLKGIE